MGERTDFRPDDTGELKERWRAYIQDRRLNITAHLAIGGVGTQGRCRASLHLLLHSLTLARDGLKG